VNLVAGLNQFKTLVLDLLFPPRCVGCGAVGSFLCSPCQSALPYLPPPLCAKCGRSLCSGTLCYDCENGPIEIEGIRSLFPFNGIVRQAILQFKYRSVKALAVPLAQMMRDYLGAHPMPADTLIPVPLHSRRLRERGYNQSSLLARELRKLTYLPTVEESLIRVKNTPPQTRTNSAENRQSNVADAFTCRDQQVAGRRILLIDDVCTSGATLDACATALKTGGATSVWGLTLAREV
jgi:ComF family protein